MKNISKPAALVAAIVSVICAGSVNAQVSAVIGGQANGGANYVNFDSLTSGQTSLFTSGALSVSFLGDAAEDGPGASAPYLSGNNNLNFGSIYAGPDTTPYIATGLAGQGSLLFDFSSAQSYLGLLWGSVDSDNSLVFYSGLDGTGTIVDTVLGSDLETLNPLIALGNTSLDGTAYVNINTGSPFQSVIATTGTTTFEIDNVAYGTAAVPDGGMTVGFLGGALMGLQAMRRKLSR